MSKASERARMKAEAEKDLRFPSDRVIAYAQDDGSCVVSIPDYSVLSGAEAERFGRWLIDTFGEPESGQ